MPTKQQQQALRRLPAVHLLLEHPALSSFLERFSRKTVVEIANEVLATERRRMMETDDPIPPDPERIVARIAETLDSLTAPRLRPVINGSGIVLHTNLGRARLSQAALRAVQDVALSYSNLEYRLHTGQRGSRHEHVEAVIRRLTGAEAALVVNNNAAAVLLVLRTLALGREVIVSRGQMVEIGGSFRVSEIMRESGARLVEVGTTNKTRREDYEGAISGETALLMKVHTSNFKIIGFTESVSREEMVEIARKHGIPCYEDLGSGVLYDLRARGIGEEPTVQECLRAGVDLVSFSGDKLLGGPQAGIIVGKKKWIDALKKSQLLRALRVDKMTLAALEATLLHYLNPEEAAREIPVLRQILKKPEEIRASAERLKERLQNALGEDLQLEVIPTASEVGGGSLPGVELPSFCLSTSHRRMPVHRLEEELRRGNPAVIGRVSKDRLLLDLRTVEEEEHPHIEAAFRRVLEGQNGRKN
ncbi:L-seryl-tRNA(Sec) selenium transferase [Planifilum fimeticola]